MKNTSGALATLAILFLFVLACGGNPFAESGARTPTTNGVASSPTPPVANATPGTTTAATGVRECDEVVDALTSQMDNPEDNFAVRAIKNYAISSAKESLKQAIENNKNNMSDLTKRCQDIKRELDKALSSPPQQQ